MLEKKNRNLLLQGAIIGFVKENGTFYLLCGICLFLFAYFFLSPFLPFLHKGEAVFVIADASYLVNNIKLFPIPHLSFPTDYFAYPYQMSPVYLTWTLEHDYLAGICQALIGYGPWEQIYLLFSLAITAIGSYHLLRYHGSGQFQATFFALAFAFANYAAICKYPGHFTLCTLHWAFLGILTDFCLLEVYWKKEHFPPWLILLRIFLFVATLGGELGYYATTSISVGMVTILYMLIIQFCRSPRNFGEWIRKNSNYFIRNYRNGWNYCLTALIILYAWFLVPIVLQIFQRAVALNSPVIDTTTGIRLILPCFPNFNVVTFQSGNFAIIDTVFAGNAGWFFLFLFFSGIILAFRKNFKLYLPFTLFFLLLLFFREIPLLKLLPLFQAARIAERFSPFYVLFLSIPFLSIPKSYWTKKFMPYFTGGLAFLFCLEIVTAYSQCMPWRSLYKLEPQSKAFYQAIDKIRPLPGEALFFYPFSLHGGDGTGEKTFSYLTAHQMALAGLAKKKMNGFYGGRLNMTQDELPLFFSANWNFLLQNVRSRELPKQHQKILLDYFKNTNYSAILLFTDFISPKHRQTFYSLFGSPMMKFRYLDFNVELIDVSGITKNVSNQKAFLKTLCFPKVSLNLELKALSVNANGRKIENQIILNKNGVQHGPYMPLSQGRYRIEIEGEHLSVLSFSCHHLIGKKKVKVEDLQCSAKRVSYCINLPEKVENIEFVARNSSDQTARLFSVSLIPLEK